MAQPGQNSSSGPEELGDLIKGLPELVRAMSTRQAHAYLMRPDGTWVGVSKEVYAVLCAVVDAMAAATDRRQTLVKDRTEEYVGDLPSVAPAVFGADHVHKK